VSKKDRQQKPEPTTGAEAVRQVHQQISKMDDAALGATVEAIAARDDAASMGSEARIQHLEAELAKALARADDEYRRAEEAMLKAQDLSLIAKAARHGAPPEGFEPKTAEGKEALEQVVLLGNVAATQRARADSEAKGRNELASDLIVLEQTAAGRAPDIALQTDLGKSAAHALSECLTMMDKMNEQRLEGPALPLGGWASATARQLVEAVSPNDRALLLGDLLAQLLPHTGEQGQNETASDVVRRIINDLELHKTSLTRAHADLQTRARQIDELSERMVKIQSAMVARRAPDAEAGALIEQVERALHPVLAVHWPSGKRPLAPEAIERVVAEWMGLRAFFSDAPLAAVAVRDDGHKGPVRERYSLLVLKWDGKAVSTTVIEGTRPWGDISPYLEQTTRKHLIPAAYR
jgi:hypothetical protein